MSAAKRARKQRTARRRRNRSEALVRRIHGAAAKATLAYAVADVASQILGGLPPIAKLGLATAVLRAMPVRCKAERVET